MESYEIACVELARRTTEGAIETKAALDREKRVLAHRFRVPMLKNRELVSICKKNGWKVPLVLLQKPTRSLSGICVVAVMTPPRGCVASCSFCPSSRIGVPTPKSYTGLEPSTRRSIRHAYNPFQVIVHRLEQLERLGHATTKVELILQGGTFPAEPVDHQQFIVRRCLEAFAGHVCGDLAEAKRACEQSPHRLVGFTVETRPDWCTTDDIRRFLDWGVTRVELGVQLPDDGVYAATRRGHSVDDVVAATRRLRDAGLKVGYHLMPGQPGSSKENDLEKMKTVFSDERFLPDFVKFYPCLVIPGTALYRDWKEGRFKPLSTIEAAELLGEIQAFVPEFSRVMRIQRDIPANLIADGVTKGNLRELVDAFMRQKGIACRCIRCREAGLLGRARHTLFVAPPVLRRLDYAAAGGTEVFLSLVDPDSEALVALLRLRRTGSEALEPLEPGDAVVRELRVFSRALDLGSMPGVDESQHRGLGSRLLDEAKAIAFGEWKSKRLAVTSGLGVREYYYKHGFSPWGLWVALDANGGFK